MTTVPDTSPQPVGHLLRYNNVAVWLHWLTAILILTQIYVGFTFHGMDRGPARMNWFEWHKALGGLVLVLGIARLAWRLMNPPPPFPEGFPAFERYASAITHWTFYFLIIALPLTGLAGMGIKDGATTTSTALGIPLPLIPGLSEDLRDGLHEAHEIMVKVTIALLILHVGAALKHQFFDHRRLAGRMPPFRAPGGEDADAPAGQPGD